MERYKHRRMGELRQAGVDGRLTSNGLVELMRLEGQAFGDSPNLKRDHKHLYYGQETVMIVQAQ